MTGFDAYKLREMILPVDEG